MSTTPDLSTRSQAGAPELTALGRQLEMLRLERGLSKQGLARDAGTSRQQLWRVMTGKSELTTSLCHRLAETLAIDARALRNPERFARALIDVADGAFHPGLDRTASVGSRGTVPDISRYLADTRNVLRTLATYPGGEEGRALKRSFLDALEDCAAAAGVKLGSAFFTVRGRVVNGEL